MTWQVSEEEAQHAADRAGVDLREDYSGRGMYGKTCVGIVTGNVGKLYAFVRNLVSIEAIDEVTATRLMTMVSQDSMGLSTIYYWPDLTLV